MQTESNMDRKRLQGAIPKVPSKRRSPDTQGQAKVSKEAQPTVQSSARWVSRPPSVLYSMPTEDEERRAPGQSASALPTNVKIGQANDGSKYELFPPPAVLHVLVIGDSRAKNMEGVYVLPVVSAHQCTEVRVRSIAINGAVVKHIPDLLTDVDLSQYDLLLVMMTHCDITCFPSIDGRRQMRPYEDMQQAYMSELAHEYLTFLQPIVLENRNHLAVSMVIPGVCDFSVYNKSSSYNERVKSQTHSIIYGRALYRFIQGWEASTEFITYIEYIKRAERKQSKHMKEKLHLRDDLPIDDFACHLIPDVEYPLTKFTSDGLHLNEAGREFLARRLPQAYSWARYRLSLYISKGKTDAERGTLCRTVIPPLRPDFRDYPWDSKTFLERPCAYGESRNCHSAREPKSDKSYSRGPPQTHRLEDTQNCRTKLSYLSKNYEGIRGKKPN